MINLSVPARIVASKLQCSLNYYMHFVLFVPQLSIVFVPTINFVLFPPTLVCSITHSSILFCPFESSYYSFINQRGCSKAQEAIPSLLIFPSIHFYLLNRRAFMSVFALRITLYIVHNGFNSQRHITNS